MDWYLVSSQLYFTINLEEIFYFNNKKMPYLCGVWRFANAYDEKKWEGEGVIFASLSNSPINGELEAIREKIGKDMPLFLTTVRIPHDTFEEESNSKIKKFVEENDHTYLIDWYAASEGHDEYFDADDTHLLSAGAKAYAKCIKEAVLDAYKKENIEIPKSRLVSSTDTSTDSSNDSSTNASTE